MRALIDKAMSVEFRYIIWLFPYATLLHVLDEWPGFPTGSWTICLAYIFERRVPCSRAGHRGSDRGGLDRGSVAAPVRSLQCLRLRRGAWTPVERMLPCGGQPLVWTLVSRGRHRSCSVRSRPPVARPPCSRTGSAESDHAGRGPWHRRSSSIRSKSVTAPSAAGDGIHECRPPMVPVEH